MTDARRAHRYLIIGLADPITPSGTGIGRELPH
jgi:hypothetical protein